MPAPFGPFSLPDAQQQSFLNLSPSPRKRAGRCVDANAQRETEEVARCISSKSPAAIAGDSTEKLAILSC